jgi:DNA modification methylase
MLAAALNGDPEIAPPPPPVARTSRGELWQIGSHRLICGDSTDHGIVDRLLDARGSSSVVTFTSPPYNAGKSEELSGNTHSGDNKYKEYDDAQAPEDYLGLLEAFTLNALRVSACVIVNIQQLAGNKVTVIDYLHRFREHFIDVAVWDKVHSQPSMAKDCFNKTFEYVFFFSPAEMPRRTIPTAAFHRGTLSDIYRGMAQRANEFSHLHAATFPLHFAQWAIANFSHESDIVFDPFGGTGTTLIAAEMLKRRAALVELDPIYCDVILERYALATGIDPVRLADGMMWSQLKDDAHAAALATKPKRSASNRSKPGQKISKAKAASKSKLDGRTASRRSKPGQKEIPEETQGATASGTQA